MKTSITVTVTPGGRRARIAGRHGDGWKVRVAAPAERGRANAALVDLLADALRVPRERVAVVRGVTARRKTVSVDGLSAAEVDERLATASG